MPELNTYKSTPIGSLITKSNEEGEHYIQKMMSMPPKLVTLLMSSNTGAYVVGLTRAYKLEPSLGSVIAFNILKIVHGDLALDQLSLTLASELQITLENALKMADEIDRDLFLPIQSELDAFWVRKNAGVATPIEAPTPSNSPFSLRQGYGRQAGRGRDVARPIAPRQPQNVLNLKEITAQVKEKELNARPVQARLAPAKPVARILPPPPTPPRAGGEATPPARTFPLPPTPR